MSAYLVSKAHVDYIVHAAIAANAGWRRGSVRFKGQHIDTTNSNDLGRALWFTNAASVMARYPDTSLDSGNMPGPCGIDRESLMTYTCPKMRTKVFNPVAALKALACYEYQSCEHEGWQGSEVQQFCDNLQGVLITMLPGYDDAPWGIEEDTRIAA